MLIGAKTARPCSIVGEIQHPVYRSHFDSPLVLLQASPGCLHPESLAGVLQERQREVIWLRFGAEDRDPANCLLSLVGAFGRFEPQAVEAARLLIHREPGPLYGWPRLYSGLAAGIRDAIHSPVTLVLQNTHLLGSPLPSLRLLGEHFLPHLPGNLQVVLTATATLALHAPSRPTTWISEKELLLDEITARRFFQQAGIELSSRALQRLMHLSQGKAGALSCLRRMCEQLGELYLNEIVLNKRGFSQAMLQYVQDSLESMDRASVEALSVLASLGYDHPDFRPAQSDHPINPDGAWATSLEDGWLALQSLSRLPLQHTLKGQQLFHTGILQTTVDYLCQNQAYEEGVRLLLQSGSPAQAAGRIVEHLPRLLNNGQWSLLENWLDDLPQSIQAAQPWLAHARGEIAAARGNLSQAAQAFAQARNGFTSQDNPEGLWLTWIALYTLAIWRSDLPGAWSCARQALGAAPNPWQVSWTEYLIGQLSLSRGDPVAAAAHLARAVEMAENGSVREHIRKIRSLAQRQGEIETQHVQQRQALQALEAEHAQVESHLQSLLSHPLEADLDAATWLQLPLIARLPTPYASEASPSGSVPQMLGQKLAAMFQRMRKVPLYPEPEQPSISKVEASAATAAAEPAPPPAAASAGLSATGCVNLDETPGAETGVNLHPDVPSPIALLPAQVAARHVPAQVSDPGSSAAALPPPAADKLEAIAPTTLTAHMFGIFRLAINERPVLRLPGGRSGALLKYLVCNHSQRLAREVLMDAFWPEAEPEAARNSLNVAIHQVRRALRLADSEALLVFEDGRYGMRSDVQVWLDVDEFELNLGAARKHLAAGRAELAVRHLESAASLYQGDFLLEDLYEEWAVAIRERLRLAYLEALDQLSRYYYSESQYSACISLCQRILEKDDVREDVHCLLMRSYAHLNQFHLALRQYQVCRETLRKELKVEPARATQELYQRMRQREITLPRPSA